MQKNDNLSMGCLVINKTVNANPSLPRNVDGNNTENKPLFENMLNI